MKPDLRTTDTKERVIAEAWRLYQLGGYSYLNMDHIAKTLKITRPALYFHFPGGKDQLIVEVIKFWSAEVIKQLESAARENQDARTRLKHIMYGVTRQPLPDDKEIVLSQLCQLSKQAQNEMHQLIIAINQIIIGVIEEGIRNGELRQVDPNIVFISFTGLCRQVEKYPVLRQLLPQDFVNKFPDTVEEIADKLLELWFEGIIATSTN
ncbi:TetR/AcrR family transcriptional regulator [Candidatus Chlorohelix sp.]|uniref:TetR/AcrR family transcriptional regulator n=1 Tax=Candidatus Chlorohelix sp. TaxID=3139201 RepID=UPI00304185EE